MSNKFKVTLYTLQQLSDKEKMQKLWAILDNPIVSPKFYDSVERAKIPFNSDAVAIATKLYEDEGFLFVRGGKDGFLGVFSRQSQELSTWSIWLDIKAMQGKKKHLWLEWFFHLCGELPILYGKGASVIEDDAKHSAVTVLPNGGRISGKVGVSIAEFYKYLPGIYWLNIFGADLTKAFSEIKLMALPDSEVWRINSHQIAFCLLDSVLPNSMEQRLQKERYFADILGSIFFFDQNRKDLKFEIVPQLAKALKQSSSNIKEGILSKIEREEEFKSQIVISLDNIPWKEPADLAEQLVIFLHNHIENIFSFSLSVLESLDTFFVDHPQQLEYNKEHLYKEFIPSLGAYLGEVLVRELGGEWIRREPLLKSDIKINGKEISTFLFAYRVVYENEKILNIYSII
jgi:hypothetical protein